MNLTNAVLYTGVIKRRRSLTDMPDLDPIEVNCFYNQMVKLKCLPADTSSSIKPDVVVLDNLGE